METPSWILHPVIFPSSARALSREGGAVTSLPRTTTVAEGGHLLTKVSAKKWLYKPPPHTKPTPPCFPYTIKVFAPFVNHKHITACKIKMRTAAPSPFHPQPIGKKKLLFFCLTVSPSISYVCILYCFVFFTVNFGDESR